MKVASWSRLVVLVVSAISSAVANLRRNIDDKFDFDYDIQVVQPLNNDCYSCASSAYLTVWNHLLIAKYYPPKNFTERCWEPDSEVGTIACTSACYTIVEEVYTHGGRAVMRGCVDKLLLFGLDVDIREAIISYAGECRLTDRQVLELVPLQPNNPVVLVCTCIGRMCNKDNAARMLSTAPRIMASSKLLVSFCSFIALLNAFVLT
uniref:Saposin B-type domain-containing protein n=1 Tax=Panagrellus redivivus TaxID=6233 RepID=A0A7E4UMP3_PANRE